MHKFTTLTGTVVVQRCADELIRAACVARDPLAFVAVCCIGGERVYNCDEALCLVAETTNERGETKQEVVGLATIAPRGESGDSETAEIVGLFVADSHRARGLGSELFACAVARCKERAGTEPSFARVRVSCVTKMGLRVVQLHLAQNPADMHYLEARDHSQWSPW